MLPVKEIHQNPELGTPTNPHETLNSKRCKKHRNKMPTREEWPLLPTIAARLQPFSTLVLHAEQRFRVLGFRIFDPGPFECYKKTVKGPVHPWSPPKFALNPNPETPALSPLNPAPNPTS